ncbi:Fic family protein [Limnobacter litoralis]|uniref:Fido domain-containing protein n=1 Tax=Limnobacter litoralis TaxID=481366 RepID=A0ABQ5YW19_9BURK|nr:Fic family protein [Limnobacter litoralis]GLR27431.1 hypothetical protein GCM10007875_25220 [Limnobacter litoralis]
MPIQQDFLKSIQSARQGLSLSELLGMHPEVSRRTAQRLVAAMIDEHLIRATGIARARRYFLIEPEIESRFPTYIPLSADSRDVLAYIDQPLPARKPIGYQTEFLNVYQPGKTWYLSSSIRRQLHAMGKTANAEQPAGTHGRAILNRLLIDLSWASSHLEGNTYSRLDTRELIEQGRVAEGKATMETQMILNHKSAIELLVENMNQVGINRYTLMNLHSALSENLLPNPADEGRIRQHAVDIGKSVYQPLATPQQIEAVLELLLDKANVISDPFEQSFFLMVHLPYLQPFADINKRTSRILANLPLFRENLCPLTFLGVPVEAYSSAMLGVYEMTRIELLRDLYVWAYERSTQEYLAIQQTLAEPDPLRLAWRELIKQTIHDVVLNREANPMGFISKVVKASVPPEAQQPVQELIIDELRRLHEGVLARYGLKPSDYLAWRQL